MDLRGFMPTNLYLFCVENLSSVHVTDGEQYRWNFQQLWHHHCSKHNSNGGNQSLEPCKKKKGHRSVPMVFLASSCRLEPPFDDGMLEVGLRNNTVAPKCEHVKWRSQKHFILTQVEALSHNTVALKRRACDTVNSRSLLQTKMDPAMSYSAFRNLVICVLR